MNTDRQYDAGIRQLQILLISGLALVVCAGLAVGAGWAGLLAVSGPLAGLILVLVAIVLTMALRSYRVVVAQREAFARDAQQNDQNQQAILRLLDEIATLADGDLTVKASVTEEITGAIADSINFAIEAMRGLVETIQVSAVSLDAAAKSTQAAAAHLAKASAGQSKQVTSATESVAEMASSIEGV